MDVRERTFGDEVGSRFDFLLAQGFIRSDGQTSQDPRSRPRSLSVTYQSVTSRVEVSLSFGFMGEDAVLTRVDLLEGSHEIGPTTAHKGHEMRNALAAHAGEVSGLIGGLSR